MALSVGPTISAPIELTAPFPVVGIGASAGGLAAFEAFFSGMPADADPDMAFVLIQHLSPDHKSILSELIRKFTRMEVFEVEDGIEIRQNCVYVIPPNCDIAIASGALLLTRRTDAPGYHLPIDHFFIRWHAPMRHRDRVGGLRARAGRDAGPLDRLCSPRLSKRFAFERLTKGEKVAPTAGVFNEDRVRCQEAGMDDFLEKPVRFEQLRDVLVKILGEPGDRLGSGGVLP